MFNVTRARIALSLLFVVTLLANGCGSAATTPAAGTGSAPSGTAAPKSFVMAISAEPSTLGPFQVGGTSHQGPVYQVLHDFLVVHGEQGQAIPHLAEEQPSQAKGTWQVAAEGTMETTWQLRHGVRWHDGTELTARDVIFGWRIASDRAVPWSRPALAWQITDMRAPDDYTVVMSWKNAFPFADNPEETTLDPLPAHILEPVYQNDVQGFINSPYWTREFVGLGPFRLTAWEPGSHLDMQAVEDHYLGKAKIGRINVRFVTDANTMVANFLSGAVDVNVPSSNLTEQHWATLKEQWREGDVIPNIDGTFSFVAPNHRVNPFGDVRIRRALAYGVDRTAVVDAQLVGREAIADGMVLPGSDHARQFKDRIQVYNYDPARAVGLLEEAGFPRGGDGTARGPDGQPFEFEYRSTRAIEGQVIADLWKAIGLTANIVVPAPNLTTDLEYQATVRGVESAGFGLGFGMWERRMHTSAIPTQQTRYAGTNRRYYSNPQLDALIDRFTTSLSQTERDGIEGDMLEIVSRDAVLAPLFVSTRASVVRKGITGVKPMAGSPIVVANYYNTWNILDWDRT